MSATNPEHYRRHPSGVECIEITEHFGFCLGNAIKYIWRADHKGGCEDLAKAIWYLEREIARRRGEAAAAACEMQEVAAGVWSCDRCGVEMTDRSALIRRCLARSVDTRA